MVSNAILNFKRNLDDVTKNIYKENVQLTESFKLHSAELESIKKQNRILLAENESVKTELYGDKALVKEKVDQAAKQAKQIREVIYFKKLYFKLIFKTM